MSACQTGQKIIVKNEDPVLHNVHIVPTNPANPEENRAQLPHGPDLVFNFKAPENFVVVKCDVHPWMFAFISVFDHPYFLGERHGRHLPHSRRALPGTTRWWRCTTRPASRIRPLTWGITM